MTRRYAMLSVVSAASASLLAQESERKLSAEEVKEILEKKKNVFFLDVREPKEIEEFGSIKGYVNIPLGQLESRLSEIPKDKVIITA